MMTIKYEREWKKLEATFKKSLQAFIIKPLSAKIYFMF
jgi:hypothetical protein